MWLKSMIYFFTGQCLSTWQYDNTSIKCNSASTTSFSSSTWAKTFWVSMFSTASTIITWWRRTIAPSSLWGSRARTRARARAWMSVVAMISTRRTIWFMMSISRWRPSSWPYFIAWRRRSVTFTIFWWGSNTNRRRRALPYRLTMLRWRGAVRFFWRVLWRNGALRRRRSISARFIFSW